MLSRHLRSHRPQLRMLLRHICSCGHVFPSLILTIWRPLVALEYIRLFCINLFVSPLRPLRVSLSVQCGAFDGATFSPAPAALINAPRVPRPNATLNMGRPSRVDFFSTTCMKEILWLQLFLAIFLFSHDVSWRTSESRAIMASLY